MYYCRFRAGGRLIRQRLSADFKVACTLLREMQARAARTDFGLTDNDFPWQKLVDTFLHWKRQTSRHPEEFERTLQLLAEYRPVTSVREFDLPYVLGFREWRLAQGVTPRTINKQVGHLNHLLNMAVAWRHIGSNPLASLRPLRHDSPAKQRRSLSLAEVQALFAHSPAYLRPVWQLLMTTGLRKRELANLVFDDVDFARRTLTVRAASAKSHKSREVPLSDDMLSTLARLRDEAATSPPPRAQQPAHGRCPASRVLAGPYLRHASQHALAQQPAAQLLRLLPARRDRRGRAGRQCGPPCAAGVVRHAGPRARSHAARRAGDRRPRHA